MSEDSRGIKLPISVGTIGKRVAIGESRTCSGLSMTSVALKGISLGLHPVMLGREVKALYVLVYAHMRMYLLMLSLHWYTLSTESAFEV